LLITDPASGGIRPTIDVDTIVEVKSYAEYAALSERLRNLGLAEDSSSSVICRWRKGDLLIDVMPTEERILSNRWYTPAIATAQWVHVDRVRLQLITAPYFLATKLEAFRGRGRGDFAGSHDLEDVIAVIDGRVELIGEVAPIRSCGGASRCSRPTRSGTCTWPSRTRWGGSTTTCMSSG
jgi:hypothetical protein